jgi:ferredoxin-nitrite reductase
MLKNGQNGIKKKQKDGLESFDDIQHYAKIGFDSIPKEEWDLFKWAGLEVEDISLYEKETALCSVSKKRF